MKPRRQRLCMCTMCGGAAIAAMCAGGGTSAAPGAACLSPAAPAPRLRDVRVVARSAAAIRTLLEAALRELSDVAAAARSYLTASAASDTAARLASAARFGRCCSHAALAAGALRAAPGLVARACGWGRRGRLWVQRLWLALGVGTRRRGSAVAFLYAPFCAAGAVGGCHTEGSNGQHLPARRVLVRGVVRCHHRFTPLNTLRATPQPELRSACWRSWRGS